MTGIRRLLNETALTELENVRICLPKTKRTSRKASKVKVDGQIQEKNETISSIRGANEDVTLPEFSTSQASANTLNDGSKT